MRRRDALLGVERRIRCRGVKGRPPAREKRRAPANSESRALLERMSARRLSRCIAATIRGACERSVSAR